MNFNHIYAIAKKQIKLDLRFKYGYFFDALIVPLRWFVMFAIIYGGFFSEGADTLGMVERENFIQFLLLGSLAYSYFASGFSLFHSKFVQEKYWKTIQGILIAPFNKMDFILGMGLSELLRHVIITPFFLIILYALSPASLNSILLIIITILLMYFGVLGISLLQGVVYLINEDVLPLFSYLFWTWGIFSCFYYPIEALPAVFNPLVELNPIYHGLVIVREVWIYGTVSNFLYHLEFVLSFAIIAPLVSIFIFNKVITKYGITGY